jgi:hypothetical protein
MKKIVKIFSLIIITTFLTGCIKYDIGMEIGKDKSVVITIINASKNNLGSDIEKTNSNNADTLETKGYIKELYKEDSWSGYKMTKKYKNIDDISTNDTITVELSDLLDKNKEEIKVFFQKKKSFFKTTYKANFTININANEDGSTNHEYDNYKDKMELKYTVKLPSASINQNTTNITNDGRTLTWNLEYGKVNKINYEFSMVKVSSYVLIISIIIIILAIVTIIIRKKNNKKTGKHKNNFNKE